MSGGVMSGVVMSGGVMSGDLMSGDLMSGVVMSSDLMSGVVMSGGVMRKLSHCRMSSQKSCPIFLATLCRDAPFSSQFSLHF